MNYDVNIYDTESGEWLYHTHSDSIQEAFDEIARFWRYRAITPIRWEILDGGALVADGSFTC